MLVLRCSCINVAKSAANSVTDNKSEVKSLQSQRQRILLTDNMVRHQGNIANKS